MKGHLDAEHLREYSYKDLQALAKDMGVSASGKTEEIIARIAAVELDVSESELTEEEKALFDAEIAQLEEQEVREQAEESQSVEKTTDGQKAREEAEAASGPVKVKAVTRFLDKQLNQIKDSGEAYSVSRERATELVVAGVAEIAG